MKGIIVVTLLVLLYLSLYPDFDLAEGHMRRPLRHAGRPVRQGGFQRDWQSPRRSWERMIMLEAGRRGKRGPINIDLGVGMQTGTTSSKMADCKIICSRNGGNCPACARICPEECCPSDSSSFAEFHLAIFLTGESCVRACMVDTNFCGRNCRGCPDCCRDGPSGPEPSLIDFGLDVLE